MVVFKPRRIKEIVKYAQSKNVEVIPEIEMAHVSSAIACILNCLVLKSYWCPFEEFGPLPISIVPAKKVHF
jgi:hypothetical protein